MVHGLGGSLVRSSITSHNILMDLRPSSGNIFPSYLETPLFCALPDPFPTCINKKKKKKHTVLKKAARSWRHLWDEVSADRLGFAASGFLNVFLLSLCSAQWKWSIRAHAQYPFLLASIKSVCVWRSKPSYELHLPRVKMALSIKEMTMKELLMYKHIGAPMQKTRVSS